MPAVTEDGQRYYALLTATSDTVFFSYQTNDDQTAIWIEGGKGNTGFDADLYVESSRLPDRNSRASATEGTSNEFLDGRYGGAKIFVAVHSRQGAGVVELHIASRKENARKFQRICTDYNPANAAERENIETVIDVARRSFWAMTEGKVAVEGIAVKYGSCDGDLEHLCNVCIHSTSLRAHSGLPIHLYATETTQPIAGGRTLAHEWGHAILGLPDEYVDHGPYGGARLEHCHADDLCRASAMDDQQSSLNLCTFSSHGRVAGPHVCAQCHSCNLSQVMCGGDACGPDYQLACTTCNKCNECPLATPLSSRTPSAWEQIASGSLVRAGLIPENTPDATTYAHSPVSSLDFKFPTSLFPVPVVSP